MRANPAPPPRHRRHRRTATRQCSASTPRSRSCSPSGPGDADGARPSARRSGPPRKPPSSSPHAATRQSDTAAFGPSRGLLDDGPDYLEHAHTEIFTWALIESAAGLKSLEAIPAVPKLDGARVGARALEIIVVAAHAAGRLAGAFCADGPTGRELVELGYDFVTPGNDVAQIRAVAAERVKAVRSSQ